jgi:hypothetical protein
VTVLVFYSCSFSLNSILLIRKFVVIQYLQPKANEIGALGDGICFCYEVMVVSLLLISDDAMRV